jgi:hypothetical protein
MGLSLDTLKKKVFNVDGLTVTIGGAIVVVILAYLIFVKKILK